MHPVFYTASELSGRGSKDIPRELVSTTHLIYSSPATLAFNSPGAEGYGVKRAGLAVPGSVMLIVSPGCCGRNTSAISRMPGYEDRFFYLTMDETDLVTGRHLKKIPGAVAQTCRGLAEKGKTPRAVMICITCVDALLGTDMERICRRAQERLEKEGFSGIRVQPCYMYALTREGRKPPMVHVRQSIYELLEPRRKKASSVNILGFFAPLQGGDTGSELPDLLRQAGVRRIRQIGSCRDYDEFQEMGEANFNLVLNPEARPAAYDLQKRLGIPSIELVRFYQIDRIEAQYAALGRVLQTTFDDRTWKQEAQEAVEDFRRTFPQAVFSIGEAMNGNPFELACALVREGFAVREIFGTVSTDSFVWIDLLAKLSPETRIYSNLHPSMLHYADGARAESGVTVTIGRDAGWYHPGIPNVQWITDVQPFGYRAVTGLFRALKEAMETGSRGSFSPDISLGNSAGPAPACKKTAETVSAAENAAGSAPMQTGVPTQGPAGFAPIQTGVPTQGPAGSVLAQADALTPGPAGSAPMQTDAAGSGEGRERAGTPAGKIPKGYRSHTTPFAPDQSGAVSVLYDMGGITVICDAGGCTGNICGFDEPRWFGRQSAVFSAGLRDMDAILGRDDRLVEKLADAADQIPASFAAVIGTPVPAVIGTDYRALCRMASKKTGLPVLGVSTDGMEYYDKGLEKTYLALLETFCRPGRTEEPGKTEEAGRTKDPGKTEEAEKAEEPGKTEKPEIIEDPGKTEEPGLTEISGKTEKSDETNGPDPTVTKRTAGGRMDGTPGPDPDQRILGVWGYSPLDFAGILSGERLRALALEGGYDRIICCGAGTAAEDLADLAFAEKNIVLSPAGAAAAKWLQKQFGTPWEYCIPDSGAVLERLSAKSPAGTLARGRRALVVHQQVLAGELCRLLRLQGMRADTASFFMMDRDLIREGDVSLREETDLRRLVLERGYDLVVADRSLGFALEGLDAELVHLPHFAVSGEQSV